MVTWKIEPRPITLHWRSPATWLLLLVVGVFVAAACGGGSGSDPVESEPAMFDEQGNPITVTESEMDEMREQEEADDSDGAPEFQIELFGNANHPTGELISLSQYLGQVVVVNFWFPSCPPCRAEMPDLQESFLNHQADDVEFIGIQLLGLDSADDGQEFIESIGVTYALGPDADGTIFQEYEVTNFPTTFFLDRNHNINRKWGGFLTSEILEEQIQKALSIEVSPTA